jgi:hypothetical protein
MEMNRIEQLCKQIDVCIVSITNHGLCTGNFLRDLGDYIQQHRTEVAKEMAGLKQDVHSEVAFEKRDEEIERLRSDVKYSRDQYTEFAKQNHNLRKRLFEELGGKFAFSLDIENQKLKSEVENLKQELADLKANDIVDAEFDPSACQCNSCKWEWHCEAQKITHPTETNGYGVMGFDPGSAEGDKTVVSWTCCGKTRMFTPPKNCVWTHDAACPDCGSVSKFNAWA